MRVTPEKQANNAIRWIDSLPSYPQAPKGMRGNLGDSEQGFCCLGAGCRELGVAHHPFDGVSAEFKEKVGLRARSGILYFSQAGGLRKYYGQNSLTNINDETNAGFKRIANLLKTHPEWVFKPEVAKLIRSHYEKT